MHAWKNSYNIGGHFVSPFGQGIDAAANGFFFSLHFTGSSKGKDDIKTSDRSFHWYNNLHSFGRGAGAGIVVRLMYIRTQVRLRSRSRLHDDQFKMVNRHECDDEGKLHCIACMTKPSTHANRAHITQFLKFVVPAHTFSSWSAERSPDRHWLSPSLDWLWPLATGDYFIVSNNVLLFVVRHTQHNWHHGLVA